MAGMALEVTRSRSLPFLSKVRHILCKKQSKILEALCSIKEANKIKQVCANLLIVRLHVSKGTGL